MFGKNKPSGKEGGYCLHRAPLVVPVAVPPIEDGAVLLLEGKIVEVGAFRNLKRESSRVVDHEGAVLVPGLINCHTHLELSFLQELGRINDFFAPGDITAWIYALVHKRAELSGMAEKNLALARLALEDMHQSGVVVAADIGNLGDSSTIADLSAVRTFFFMEAFGLSAAEIQEVEKRMMGFDDLSWTCHALYSTHSELIRSFKQRAKMRGDVFPIHTAESAAEIEFLKTGKGPFSEFLGKRLAETSLPNDRADNITTDDIFSPPGKGAVAYLADLGCLDQKTLCVHCVHVDDHEIDLLTGAGAAVCLCPGSNQYLGVGNAPVTRFLQKGVRTCLGTDSLASNPKLSIWNEMKIIAGQNPAIDEEAIFTMATINGAEVLGIEQSYGSLSAGKKGVMLAVQGMAANKDMVYERLVHSGADLQVEIVRGDND